MHSSLTLHTTSSTARMRPRISRRDERRTPYRVPCRLTLLDPQEDRRLHLVGQTSNLSAAGLAVRVAAEIPEGLYVEVLLPKPGGEPTLLRGTVVHCRRVLTLMYEIGIELACEEDYAS